MSEGVAVRLSCSGLRMQLTHRLIERLTVAVDLGGDALGSAHTVCASRAGGARVPALHGRGVADEQGGGESCALTACNPSLTPRGRTAPRRKRGKRTEPQWTVLDWNHEAGRHWSPHKVVPCWHWIALHSRRPQ